MEIETAPIVERIPFWQKIEAILASGGTPLVKKAFVTSTEWAQIAKEIGAHDPIDPTLPLPKPAPGNFEAMKIGKCLTVINAGTEDADVVALMNVAEMGDDYAIFNFKRLNYRTG